MAERGGQVRATHVTGQEAQAETSMSDAPNIVPGNVPPDDKRKLFLLNCALSDMEKYSRYFGSALHLFDYCFIQQSVLPGPSGAFNSWRMIAARDAVMSIYHFKNSMIVANDLANQSTLIGPHLKKPAIKSASKRFANDFPDYAKARHGVAHTAESVQNIGALQENAFPRTHEDPRMSPQNAPDVMISDNLQGRLFTTGIFGGKIIHCEISESTLVKLIEIMRMFFDGFREIPSPVVQPAPVN
jgi:hypothetical protein